VKIVVLLRHALYLRNFESALRGLADRGHETVLVLSPIDKQVDTTLLDSLTREYLNIRQEPIGARTGWWWPASDGFRTLRDYLRYLEPEYHDAPALVERGGRRLPGLARWAFENVAGMKSAPMRRFLVSLCALIDRSIPPDPGAIRALKHWAPDLLVVSPMIDFTYGQTDYVKTARYLGIPTLLAVASWDNLTNKGLIQICPDRVLVWNAAQEREATGMHAIPADRVRKTGAQLYDHWFEMRPSNTREEFCARAGDLDPERPIILYLCSSSFICRDEVAFVKDWLRVVRASHGSAADANVIVRPHPAHWEQWNGVDLSEFGNAVVWPRGGAVPVDNERKRDYFDSLYHGDVVVGVNTSGFIEAGIVGRRTLAIRSGHFDETQEGTLHFRYLTEGALLTISSGFDEHLKELEDALRNREKTKAEIRKFIADFVRPEGLDRPATPIFIDAVETMSEIKPQTWTVPAWAPLLRAAALPPAAFLRKVVLSRTKSSGMYRGIERTTFPRLLKPRGDSTANSEQRVKEFSELTDTALAKIADSDKPIIVGPWLSEVGYELLYWIPLVRWARETYGLAPDRVVVVSRGGVKSWYGDLAHHYVDLFDYYSPAEFAAFNAERQKASGMQKQKGVADLELKLVSRIENDLGLGACDLMHPRLMYSGVLRYHWSQRSAMDHLLLHARYERFKMPEPGEVEARLPEDYYAVRFYSRESFGDSSGNRNFVRHTIERMLEKRDVVLLDSPFAIDDHTNVEWMKAAGNGSRYNNRLVRAEEWMVPRNNLDVQSRIIARSRCFVGTYGGLSYLAGFYGRPSIAFHEQLKDVMDSHYNTAMTLFRALGTPLILLTPNEANLVSDIL
jgi:hypothetical protein